MSKFYNRRSLPLNDFVVKTMKSHRKDSIHYSNQIKYERPKVNSIKIVSNNLSLLTSHNPSILSSEPISQRKTLEILTSKNKKLNIQELNASVPGPTSFIRELNKPLNLSISSNKKSIASTRWRTNSFNKSQDLKQTFFTRSCQVELKQQRSSTDFLVLKEIGQGKFSKVSMVLHKQTGFIAAMKTLSKKNINDDSLITQLLRQVKILSFVNHPNIVSLYGVYSDPQNIYLIQELGCNGQLFSILCRNKTFSEEAVSFVMKSLLSAISYLHSHKIIHRDIKPQNVVIIHGIVKLCDLGWSVHTRSKFRQTFCGTPLYSSPELIQGSKYNQKIDLWALGIMAYELKFGKAPFKIHNKSQLYKIVTDDIDFSQTSVSEQFEHFVKSLLHKDPKQRLTAQMMLKHPFILRYLQFQTCEELCL